MQTKEEDFSGNVIMQNHIAVSPGDLAIEFPRNSVASLRDRISVYRKTHCTRERRRKS